jgi:hypothetical protein
MNDAKQVQVLVKAMNAIADEIDERIQTREPLSPTNLKNMVRQALMVTGHFDG